MTVVMKGDKVTWCCWFSGVVVDIIADGKVAVIDTKGGILLEKVSILTVENYDFCRECKNFKYKSLYCSPCNNGCYAHSLFDRGGWI